MSHHRAAVLAALERLSQAAFGTLPTDVLESMRNRGIDEIVLELFPGIGSSREFSDEYVKLLAFSPRLTIDDLQEADVRLAVRFSTRDAVCSVANGRTNRRRMIVADATATVRIRTRWVHIWRESEKRLEWPCESELRYAETCT
jgi:hypothetical protein